MKRVLSFLFLIFVVSGRAQASPVRVWHDMKDGERSKIRAEGIIKAAPEDVWSHLIRFNDYDKFMPRVIDSFFVSEEGLEALRRSQTQNGNKMRDVAKKFRSEMARRPGQSWQGYVFMLINVPFPAENRWYVLDAVQDETRSEDRIYKRCWTFVMGNIRDANGCWTLKPGPDARETETSYEDNIDAGGSIPDWMARLGARKTVPEIFHSLERVSIAGKKDK